MHSALLDNFLDRVRAAYRRALAATSAVRGQWAAINDRRADVHAAALADDNHALRRIFADPTATDLYYGADRLCRSHVRLHDADDFVAEALNQNDPRAACARYQIERLCQLVPKLQSVVEIGPGMGRAAYYGHLNGIDYTTIDLPLGIVAQACFLGRALSPDTIWFEGEAYAAGSQPCIKLLYTMPAQRFDAALNVDSMTEMPTRTAVDYFSWASQHVSFLLSINHGKNEFTVAQLATFAAPHSLIARQPCPNWDGYIEEVFSFTDRRARLHAWRAPSFDAFVFAHRVRRSLKRRGQALLMS